MSNLQDAMKRLEQRFNTRRRATLPPPRPPTHSPPAAEGLFAEEMIHQRPYLESIPLNLVGVGKLVYRGQRLAIDDQAVWWALLQRAARNPREPWLLFPSLGLLRSMGWGVSLHDRQRLRSCLERLQAAWVRIPGKTPDSGRNLALIAGLEWQPLPPGKSDRWRVQLLPEVRQLFNGWQPPGSRRAA